MKNKTFNKIVNIIMLLALLGIAGMLFLLPILMGILIIKLLLT